MAQVESSRGIHQYIGDFNFTKFLALFSRVFRGKNARKHVNFTENIEERFHEILEERKEKKPLEAVKEIEAINSKNILIIGPMLTLPIPWMYWRPYLYF